MSETTFPKPTTTPNPTKPFAHVDLHGEAPTSTWFAVPNGPTIHALDWGGAGATVILLHGGGLSAHTWTYLCAAIRHQYRCVAVDLRGHGDSEWADSYRIEDHVNDMAYLLHALGAKTPHLVGMSLGGVVGAYLALRVDSNRLGSLSLVDVAPGVDFAATARIRALMDSEAVKQGVPALIEVARSLGSRTPTRDLQYRYASLIREDDQGTWRWKQDRRTATDFAHILDRLELLNTLAGSLTLPLLIARGELSSILSTDAAQAFAIRCSSATYKVIPQAGHSIQEDNPRALADALLALWQSVEIDRATATSSLV